MPAVARPGGFEALARPGGGEGLHAALLGLRVEEDRGLRPEGVAAERCREAILSLAKDRRGSDLNRVTLVATILGISPKSVKKLLKAKRSGPRLSPAAASAIADLQGTAYVSTAEIE